MVVIIFIADSSFLVALFLPNDYNHEKAKNIFIKNQEKIFISNIILYETLTVINYKGSSKEKKQAYERIISNNIFCIETITKSELDNILVEFVNHSTKLSFPDVCVVYIANKIKSKVFTFDKNILKILKKN